MLDYQAAKKNSASREKVSRRRREMRLLGKYNGRAYLLA